MTVKLPPKTRNKDHIFKNTKVFGEDQGLEWCDDPIATLSHAYNNVKLHIDASGDEEAKRWRYSNIIYKYIQIVMFFQDSNEVREV